MEEILDDEIIKQVLNPDTEEQFDDDEECKAIPRPTLKEAIEWLSGLSFFLKQTITLTCLLALTLWKLMFIKVLH